MRSKTFWIARETYHILENCRKFYIDTCALGFFVKLTHVHPYFVKLTHAHLDFVKLTHAHWDSDTLMNKHPDSVKLTYAH